MADPVVHITSGVPDAGTGNITTLGMFGVHATAPYAKITDGTNDAAVKAGSALPSASTDPALVVTIRDLNANVNADSANSLLPGAPVAAYDYYGNYKTVAASTTATMGTTGAAGNYLAGVLIIPGTTSPGAVSIQDGAATAIPIFTGGATSVSNLVPFFVPLGIYCATAWKVITLTNVTAIGVGRFT